MWTWPFAVKPGIYFPSRAYHTESMSKPTPKKSELGPCPAADWSQKVDWSMYLTGGLKSLIENFKTNCWSTDFDWSKKKFKTFARDFLCSENGLTTHCPQISACGVFLVNGYQELTNWPLKLEKMRTSVCHHIQWYSCTKWTRSCQ